jgi:tetratricopeptide (TPR) repeat protein
MQILATTLKVNKQTLNKSCWKREKPDGFSLSFFMAILFAFLSIHTFGQYNHHKIYENLLNGRFSERLSNEEIVLEENLLNKTAAASVMAITFEAFFSGNELKIENAIDITDEFLDLSSDIPYNLIIGHTSEAILKSMRGNYFSALVSFYNAYRRIRSYDKETTCVESVIFELNKFYNLTFSKIPDSYTGILSVAGISPIDIDTTKICDIKNQQLISTTFSTIFQLFEKPNSITIPENPGEMSKLIAGIYYVGNQNPDSALLYLNQMDTIRSNLTVVYYYKGLAHLNKAQYNAAEWYFDKYLFLQQSGRYIKATLLRKKWIAIINDQPTKALTKAIATRASELTYLDKQAAKEAEKTYQPQLLQSRLLYDGGKYKESLDVINQISQNTLSPKYLTNLLYRKARALQGLKRYNAAIEEYNLLLLQDNEGEYFHKKAMLELGKIYIEKKQFNSAIEHLKKVKKIDSDTFNDALEQEAELLLNKIQEDRRQ